MAESLKVQDEIQSFTSFLCSKYTPVFRRGPEEDTIEVTDPMEAIILASSTAESITPSFFLKRGDDGRLREYYVDLARDFTSRWASDHQKAYPQIFEGIKTVKFFRHWIPIGGYTGKDAIRYEAKRMDDMHNDLYNYVRKSKKELSDVLFVPYSQYGGDNNPSEQFSEAIYHYLAGLVFRESGYLIFDEYAPSLMTRSASTPDLSAFKTPEIEQILSVLRAKGIISNGAFEQELQLYSLFGRKSSVPISCKPLTDANTIAIEVKRRERVYLITEGTKQLSSYLSDACGFYDEGYIMVPLVNAHGIGFLSLDREGDLIFSKPHLGYTAPLNNSQLHKRKEQMNDVQRSMILQIFKNMKFSKIISYCSKYAEIRSFSDLWYATDQIDIGSLIDELISTKAQNDN